MECLVDAASLDIRLVFRRVVWSFKTDRAETTPAEKTNDPTPKSIRDVPQFSTLANRRGKARKSTARIATQVTTIIAARYVVRNGWTGKGSNPFDLEEEPSCFCAVRRGGGFAFW